MLEDLEASGRCGSVGSLSLVTTTSTVSPRGLSSRKASAEARKRSLANQSPVSGSRDRAGPIRGQGLATKRAELLQQRPIKPNTNVGSKLKAMLSENEESAKRRTPRVKKPSRWDAVMSKIEEGKQSVRPVSRSGIRSRVLTNLGPGTRPGSPIRNQYLGHVISQSEARPGSPIRGQNPGQVISQSEARPRSPAQQTSNNEAARQTPVSRCWSSSRLIVQ